MSPRPSTKHANPKVHWPSIIQFAGSGAGMMLFWSSALGSTMVGFYQLFLIDTKSFNPVDMFLLAAGLFWAGLLLLPSLTNSLSRLIGRPVLPFQFIELNKPFVGIALLFIFIALVALGHLTTMVQGWSLIGLPPIHVLAATIPLGLLMWMALSKLDLGSAQRRWGALASGLTLGPGLAIIVELVGGFALVLIGIIYVSLTPELNQALETFEQTVELLPPALLQDPIIIALFLANFSLLVPLIEELTKPIAVWLLMWSRPLTPAAGFGLGLLSGAGFALIENLLSGASMDHWAGTTTVRIGATAFHMATSALMGWALVRAKNEGRYLALLGVYLFNITIHAIWNGVVVLNTIVATEPVATSIFLPFDLPIAAGATLLLIGILSIFILARMNKNLQPVSVPTAVTKSKPKSNRRS